MSFSLIPKYAFSKVTEVTPEFLNRIGVVFLMLDLDNTIGTYGAKLPSAEIVRWAEDIKSHGIGLYIVSNNRGSARVKAFSSALGTGFVKGAKKPSPEGVLRAMDKAGRAREESALAGDQIFTDTIAANLAGVVSIVVPPLSCKNPLFALRYAIELPFRAMCKNKVWRIRK